MWHIEAAQRWIIVSEINFMKYVRESGRNIVQWSCRGMK